MTYFSFACWRLVGCCWRVIETEILYNATKREAERAAADADDAYRDALSIYTEAESIRVTEIDIDVLNADANQIKSEVSSIFVDFCRFLNLSEVNFIIPKAKKNLISRLHSTQIDNEIQCKKHTQT